MFKVAQVFPEVLLEQVMAFEKSGLLEKRLKRPSVPGTLYDSMTFT